MAATTAWLASGRSVAVRIAEIVPRLRPGDWGSRTTWLAAVLVAAWAVFALSGAGTDRQRVFVVDALYLPIGGLLVFSALRAALRRPPDRRTRRAWWLITVGFVLAAVGMVASFVGEGILGSSSLGVSLSGPWFIASRGVALAGLLMMPVRPRSGRERLRLTLDIVTVMSGAFMLMWYFVLGPTITRGDRDPLAAVIASVNPVGDLLLVFGVVALLLRGPALRSRRSLQVLCGGIVLLVVGDISFGYQSLNGGFSSGGWTDLIWLCANVLLIASASKQHHEMTHPSLHRSASVSLRPVGWLPYGAIAAGYGLLLIIARGEHLYPMGGMVVAAVVLTGAVVVRQLNVLQENHELAVTDPLTGIANRALVNATLDKALARSRRTGEVVGVLAIDLDGFKQINDTMGHHAGDAVLVAVGDALRAAARASDLPGRLGGDEFAVVLTDVRDAAGALRAAHRVLERLRRPLAFDGHVLVISASVGVALSDTAGTDPEALLHGADVAMYAAKRRGTGGIELYVPGMDTVTLELDLRRALERGELDLAYQPIVDLDTGTVTAIEALVRWQHPVRGAVGPDEFIPLAEESGLIVPLGTWVLRRACAQMRAWQESHPESRNVALNVNVSPRQIQDAAFTGDVLAVLEESGLDPGRLVLELTEVRVVPHDSTTVNKLLTLRERGIRLAIDDFGTGFAALSYLSRLPVDMLKIDRTYVTALSAGGQDTLLSEAIVKLGQTLDLPTVAEGVETAEQLARLRELGCPLGQGYFFAPPLDAVAMEALLARSGFGLERVSEDGVERGWPVPA